MKNDLLAAIAPGQILLKEFLEPMNISSAQLARDIDVPPSRITDIIKNRRSITLDTAVRLGIYFKMSTHFWLNVQSGYDVRYAEIELEPVLNTRVRPLQIAA